MIFAWWDGIDDLLGDIVIHPEQQLQANQIYVGIGTDTLSDAFGGEISEAMRRFIEHITPVVEDVVCSANEDDVVDHQP